VIDRLLERKAPFAPSGVVDEFSRILRQYRISKVSGDRYAGEWPAEQFRRHQITYEPAKLAKSDLYVGLLPLLTSGLIDLLDMPRLTQQIVGLERRTARSGKDSIDHAPNAHDDLANAVAGVAEMLANKGRYRTSLDWVCDDTELDLNRAAQLAFNAYIMRGGM
jgi:hypothetical protein